MSNLKRRRESRRHRASGMHPGWMCFMAAHWGGFFLGLDITAAWQWAAMRISVWPVIILTGLWFILFIIGGKKAERLRPWP